MEETIIVKLTVIFELLSVYIIHYINHVTCAHVTFNICSVPQKRIIRLDYAISETEWNKTHF